MRKKVALLLALVMVLAILPMNVFGAPTGSITPPAPLFTAENPELNTGFSRTRSVSVAFNPIDFNAIPLGQGDLYLEFQLLGGGGDGANATNEVTFRSLANVVGPDATVAPDRENWPGANIADRYVSDVINFVGTPGTSMAALAALLNDSPLNTPGNGWRVIRIPVNAFNTSGNALGEFFSGQQEPTNVISSGITAADGALSANLNMAVRHREAELRVRLVRTQPGIAGFQEVRVFAQSDLMVRERNHGVNITSDGTRAMTNQVILPQIRVQERVLGDIAPTVLGVNNPAVIRLVAPLGYRWETQPLGGVGGAFSVTSNAGITGDGDDGANRNWSTAIRFNVATQRDELNIFVGNVQRNPGPVGATTLAQLNINNARLIALAGVADGNVDIDVYVRTQTGAATPPIGTAWPTTVAILRDLSIEALNNISVVGGVTGSWVQYGLTVATRGANLLNVIAGAVAEDGISGTRSINWRTGGIDPTWLNRRTHSIRIVDLVPNSLFNELGSIQFRLVQDGARFENVGLRTSNTRGAADADTWVMWDSLHPGGLPSPITQGHRSGAVRSAEAFTIPGLTTLDRDVFTLTPRHSNLQPTYLHHIDLRFQIITEAGFEVRYGGEVEVHITGRGLDEIVTIAVVEDPIQIQPAEVLTLSRDLFGVLIPTIVNPVTFSETAAGNLRVGDVIRPAVQTVMNGSIVQLANVAEPVLNVSMAPTVNAASGLQLRVVPGTNNRDWEVVRPSIGTPAEITFTGIQITGALLPGIEYHVEIGGNRIARTTTRFSPPIETPVWGTTGAAPNWGASATATTGGPIWLGGIFNTQDRQDIRFDGLTYSTKVIEVEGAPDLLGPGDAPGVGPGHVPVRDRLVLRQGMLPITVPGDDGVGTQQVVDPFILHVTGAGYGVSMLNPRVFANFINGTITYANGVVTFGGLDANGNQVTVVLTVGSNLATINGQSVDIATFAGASGPPNSIQTLRLNDRTFVPLRFLANAFLLPITFEEGTVVLG